MSRITVLIALLGLALLAGCNQSSGSGSEWVCDSYVANETTDVYLEWTCESQVDWDECKFKYLTADSAEVDYFCEEDFVDILSGTYTCIDQGYHTWSCQTPADQAYCEVNYFEDPDSLYWCNSAFNVFDDIPIYWACPDLSATYFQPTADRRFACPRAEPTPECCERVPESQAEQYRVKPDSLNACAKCLGGNNIGAACYNPDVPSGLDNSVCTGGGRCDRGAACRRNLNQELQDWNRATNPNRNPAYAKIVPPECDFVGNDECTPIWNLDNGVPKNNCNPQAGCVLR